MTVNYRTLMSMVLKSSTGRQAIRAPPPCCCSMDFQAPATCFVTSFRCWQSDIISSRPISPALGSRTCRSAASTSIPFANIADTIAGFTEAVGLKKFAIYIFDYGSPVGLRMALKFPDRISAIVSQNGNAYEEGFEQRMGPDPSLLEGPVPGQSRRSEGVPKT
jgi:pimeloyl-ACP methyl ester carboxylesterase